MKAKTLTFNLCDYDLLNLSLVNRKGEAMYGFYFNRLFASQKARKAKKENPLTAQHVSISNYNRAASISAARLQLEFRAMDAPRAGHATEHEQTVHLDRFGILRPLGIKIVGKDGLNICSFAYQGKDNQVELTTLRDDTSLIGLTFFPDEKVEHKTTRRLIKARNAAKQGHDPLNGRKAEVARVLQSKQEVATNE
jgi:hypothetical protein